MECPSCNNKSMIKVAEVSNVEIFSCVVEECDDYAELFVLFEGDLIRYDVLLDGLTEAIR